MAKKKTKATRATKKIAKKRTAKKATRKARPKAAAKAKSKSKAPEQKAAAVMDKAKKRRHLFLLEKVAAGTTLAPYEIRELERFEAGELPDGICITNAELARALGVTTRTVEYWVADGCPKNGDGHFDIAIVDEWRKARSGKGSDADENDAAFKKWRALTAEANYKKLMGELLPRDEVEKGRVARVTAVRERLLAMPSALAGELAGLSARQINQRLTDEVREIIESFARGGSDDNGG